MSQRKKRRMCCKYCGSLETQKHGKRTITPKSYSRRTTSRVQRYRCQSCKRSFALRKEKKKQYTFGFQREAARMHVEERMSYRIIAKRITERCCWKSFRRAYNKRYGNVIRFIASQWDALLEHQRDPQILKTSVRAENINKQFEMRLKTIEAFQSVETALQYQNLYRNYLRLKSYTDCQGARKFCNGLSPMQVCQAVLPSSDWLKLAVRYPK